MRTMLLLALCGLAACADGTAIGSGPIRLAPPIQAAYDKYRRLPSPAAFAVSRDGRHAGMIYCPVGIDCRGNEISRALQSCKRSGGTDCRIYDRGGHVVWREAEPASPLAPSAAPGTASAM